MLQQGRRGRRYARKSQLREAKAHLHNTAVGITGAEAPGATQPTIPVDTHTVETVQTVEHHPSQNPLIWAMGTAAHLGGLVLMANMKSGRPEHTTLCVATPRARDATPMLNKHVDPFIMQ
jgi:hypothetical protein